MINFKRSSNHQTTLNTRPHVPRISFCYYRGITWALVNGSLFHKCIDPIPCCLPEDISQTVLSPSPTSSFSPSTKSFPLDYKQAAIPYLSHTCTFSWSYLQLAIIPCLCPSIYSKICQKSDVYPHIILSELYQLISWYLKMPGNSNKDFSKAILII